MSDDLNPKPTGPQPDESGALDPGGRSLYGRRRLLFGAAAVGAGMAAGVVAGDPADAANGGSVLLGRTNIATATTEVTTTRGDGLNGSTAAAGQSGVAGIDKSKAGGYGLYASSTNGVAIYGTITGGGSGRYAIQGVDQSTGSSGTSIRSCSEARRSTLWREPAVTVTR